MAIESHNVNLLGRELSSCFTNCTIRPIGKTKTGVNMLAVNVKQITDEQFTELGQLQICYLVKVTIKRSGNGILILLD